MHIGVYILFRALKEILAHNPENINLKDCKRGCSPLVHSVLQHQHNVAAFLLQQVRGYRCKKMCDTVALQVSCPLAMEGSSR